MKVLLLGATGLVGSRTLELALSSPVVSMIVAPTRTPLAPREKLENPVSSNIEDLISTSMSNKIDAVICALGTTLKKAGSKAAFRHVDHELPVAFARAAHSAGVETFAIVTAMAASATSRSFYLATKGKLEQDIQEIGFRSLTICRPSLIGGERDEDRALESAALTFVRLAGPLLPKKFRVNPADVIAASLLDAVVSAKPGCRWIKAEEMN